MATIMITDDTASMRQMISFTLDSGGHQVIEASDGEECLKLADENNVDLFLTDINMPNMDGIELVKLLRAGDKYKFTPIVMLTTESQKSKREEGKSAGATGWIVKPFNPEQLLEVIKKVLG